MNFRWSSPMSFMSTFFSLSATVSTMFMLLRTIFNDLVPPQAKEYIASFFSDYLFSDFTFVIEDRWQAVVNETFRAVECYLPTRVGPTTRSLVLGSCDTSNSSAPPKSGIPVGGVIIDHFEGMRLVWTLRCKESRRTYGRDKKYYHLTCKKQYRERVMESYLPHVTRTAESILHRRETLSIHSFNKDDETWESTVFKHPSTFSTLAMDPALKQSIKDDLDQFVKRKDFFVNAGRAWKRGYLLYGPPGTGKSSLVAAIANYLGYNIYDLQVQSVKSDADLRRILTATTNRSILVIEDIDCNAQTAHDRAQDVNPVKSRVKKPNNLSNPGITLSGLLNFIDGLWSSCGDQRIIIFTTNNKAKLDPALLRPGRMDFHIYMGYCTAAGLRKLASTYLGIEDHVLLEQIEHLIQRIPVTPAQVAEQLMKYSKPEVSLENLIEFLNLKEREIKENQAKEKGKEKAEKEEKEGNQQNCKQAKKG